MSDRTKLKKIAFNRGGEVKRNTKQASKTKWKQTRCGVCLSEECCFTQTILIVHILYTLYVFYL